MLSGLLESTEGHKPLFGAWVSDSVGADAEAVLSDALQTTTTTLLLDSLHDPANEPIWREFDARYRSVLTGFAQRLGLQPDDAADVAQETLTQFVRDYRAGRYNRDQGRLRSWIIRICQNRAIDLQRARARRREYRGESAILDHHDPAEFMHAWEEEERRAIFARAMETLRDETKTSERTIRAFELIAIEQQPAERVAESLGITTAEVYRIKNRVTTRLRQIVEQLTAAYEADA